MIVSEQSVPPQDLEAAKQFLCALGGRETRFTFQTFDDDSDRERARREMGRESPTKRRGSVYAQILHGTIEEHWSRLVTLNSNGAGVFVTVQGTDGAGRKFENIKLLRAVWCECDTPGPMREDWPLPPHIVVESSPQKWHYYWICEPIGHAQFVAVMRRMVRVHGSDPAAKDISRVLRLPGTWHQKRDSRKSLTGTRWLTRLAECRDLAPYTDAELIAGLGADWDEEMPKEPPQEPRRDENRPKATARRDVNISSLTEALRAVSPDDRDVWLAMGMALCGAGFSGARAMWDEWSERSSKFDAVDQQRVWESFKRRPSGEDGPVVGLGTIYETAKRAGWKPKRDAWREGLLLNERGRIIDCPANIMQILAHHPDWRDAVQYNVLSEQVEVLPGTVLGAGEWTDTASAETARWLALECKMAVRHLGSIDDAARAVAVRRPYDPLQAYLLGLPPWDGTERLSHLMADVWEIPQSDYAAALGYCLIGAMVWRAMQPGCPAPQSVVLRGTEQIGKSLFCQIVGGPWYKPITLSMESKDIYISLQRCWLGELADLDALSRTGERRVKAFMTQLVDSYRPVYARHEIQQMRRAVFVGTANPDAPLPDGDAERWLPLDVGDHRLLADLLEGMRDALFAEALACWRQGRKPWLDASLKPAAADERGKAQIQDSWEDQIIAYLMDKAEVGSSQILEECLQFPTHQVNHGAQTRVGIIMARQAGWLKTQVRVGSGKIWVWRRA